MFVYEKKKIKAGYDYIIGVDEVGRGCLAGPVIAGAAVFEIGNTVEWMSVVTDSKLLTPEKRSMLDLLIRRNAIGWGIGSVTSAQVDKLNIHNASLLAMHIAVQEVLKKFSNNSKKFLIAIDGKFLIPNVDLPQEAVVDGDAQVFSISAASIIAKVYRDTLMMKLDKKFPEYGFAQHKGYATLAHRQAIGKHGLAKIHRLSFCRKYRDS